MSSEIARMLSDQARLPVTRFEDRVDSFNGRADLLRLTKELDETVANAFAKEYFGEEIS